MVGQERDLKTPSRQSILQIEHMRVKHSKTVVRVAVRGGLGGKRGIF